MFSYWKRNNFGKTTEILFILKDLVQNKKNNVCMFLLQWFYI